MANVYTKCAECGATIRMRTLGGRPDIFQKPKSAVGYVYTTPAGNRKYTYLCGRDCAKAFDRRVCSGFYQEKADENNA